MRRLKVGFVASSGGHLAHLMWLESWWSQHERFFVTFEGLDSRGMLKGERVYWAFQPTNRHLVNLVRNTRLALTVLRREQPDVLVSTGAGVMIPFFFLGAAMGIPTVFLEVYDRIDRPSLSGRLVHPIASQVVVQWPEQLVHFPDAVNLGPIR